MFTNVPIEDVLKVIKEKMEENFMDAGLLDMLKFCLTSGYFIYNGEYYVQKDGVTMGSPVAPIVAEIWMEYFEKLALDSSPIKPKIWKRYVDDTFVVLKRNEVDRFLNHLNSLHPKMEFTSELEENDSLAFLDVLIIRKQDGTFGHTVHRKSTHTNRYLNGNSHHHPANFTSVVASLINRAQKICDSEHLQDELNHIDKVLKENNYSAKMRKWKQKPPSKNNVDRKSEKRAFLPYSKNVSDKIRRILSKYGVRTIFRPPKKVRALLRSPKDQIPLSSPGVYLVPCSCGKSYIGETKRSISVRLKEHIKAVQNNAVTKSAICEHLAYADKEHEIYFHKVKSLATERFYFPRLVREAVEIRKTPNFNRDLSFKLSSSWDPVLYGLKRSMHVDRPQDTVSIICRDNKFLSNQPESLHGYHLRSKNKSN